MTVASCTFPVSPPAAPSFAIGRESVAETSVGGDTSIRYNTDWIPVRNCQEVRVLEYQYRRNTVPRHPIAFRCPLRGWVTRERLPFHEARLWVVAANRIREEYRGLERDNSYVSEMEIELLAGFLFYGMDDVVSQYPLGPFDADFYFEAARLVVEVDGREWHEPSRDVIRDAILLRDFSVETLRFSGHEVFRDPLDCVRKTARVWVRRKRAA